MNPQQLAETLIGLVEIDLDVPAEARSAASSFRELALRNPDEALNRLDDLWSRYVPSLSLEPATEDLAKCVAIEKFWAFYLDPDIKLFVDASNYRLEIEDSPNPGSRLMEDLKQSEALIPAPNSWLVAAKDIANQSAAEVWDTLEVAI